MLHDVIVYLQHVPAHNWTLLGNTVFAFIGGGAGISVIIQFIKHKAHIDSAKVATVMLGIFSFVASLADYVLSNGTSNVAHDFAGLAVVAVFIHRFMVSPITSKAILPFLEWLQASKAQTVAQPVTPAEVPNTFTV